MGPFGGSVIRRWVAFFPQQILNSDIYTGPLNFLRPFKKTACTFCRNFMKKFFEMSLYKPFLHVTETLGIASTQIASALIFAADV